MPEVRSCNGSGQVLSRKQLRHAGEKQSSHGRHAGPGARHGGQYKHVLRAGTPERSRTHGFPVGRSVGGKSCLGSQSRRGVWPLGLRRFRCRSEVQSRRQLLRFCQRVVACARRDPGRQIPLRRVRCPRRQDPGTGSRDHRGRRQVSLAGHRRRQDRRALYRVHGRGADRTARRRPSRRRSRQNPRRQDQVRHRHPDGTREKRIRRQPILRVGERGRKGPHPQHAASVSGRIGPSGSRLLFAGHFQGQEGQVPRLHRAHARHGRLGRGAAARRRHRRVRNPDRGSELEPGREPRPRQDL